MVKINVIAKPAKPLLTIKIKAKRRKVGVKKLYDSESTYSKSRKSDVFDSDSKHETYAARKLINYNQVKDGIVAFTKYIRKTEDDEGSPVFLEVSSIKAPETPHREALFNLKHSLFSSNSKICLIVNDGNNEEDYDVTIEHHQNVLRSQGITNITTIMTYHQLKSEYGQQLASKRKLFGLYNFFLVDTSVYGCVAKIFAKSCKMPKQLDLTAPNLRERFEHFLHETSIKAGGKSDSFSIKVGHSNLSSHQMFDNVSEVIDHLNSEFPGGFENIRMIGIKTDKSITVPLYLTLRHMRTPKS